MRYTFSGMITHWSYPLPRFTETHWTGRAHMLSCLSVFFASDLRPIVFTLAHEDDVPMFLSDSVQMGGLVPSRVMPLHH